MPAVEDDDASAAEAIREFLVEQLSLGTARQPRVSGILVDGRAAIRSPAHDGPWPHDAWLRLRGFRGLQVSIPLADGQWLSFATELPAGGPAYSARFLLSMGVMALIILAVSVWAVRRVTAPLGSLAAAAERLGQ